ncbi:MAG: tetratricopeptide repeat protein [Lentisphaerae bacterium]|jgi:tetratricopeptide (TPR) repeat protein|nr:tetratricopeptide repeat protein [Lentisphaerota bacterium]MBT5610183.1 tetratricopeptide repeat protein [Lentisphaerota bacterium]MBT7057084.1 tetratricopeptide repeat protein [Lentisphaerota bacterium]MBT7846193.1 tetratricopeptide repeat protein [Lentisphaerota bacterium]
MTAKRFVLGVLASFAATVVLTGRAADVDYAKAVAEAQEAADALAVNRLCNEWATKAPGDERPRMILGRALFEAGMEGRAIEQFELAAEANPFSPAPRCELGKLFRQAGKVDAAVKEYEQALKRHPKHVPALLGIVQARLDVGDRQGALAAATRAQRAAPENASVQAAVAECLWQLGKPSESRSTFEQALKSEPDNADALFGVARAMEAAGNGKEAQEHWERFLVREPGSERARAVRNGWVVLERKLMAVGKNALAPSVSPDGNRLICGYDDLRVVNMQDGSVAKLSITDGKILRSPRWSSDGRRVAASLGWKLDYQAVIYEFRADGSLGPAAAPKQAHANWAELSPDGTRLLLSDVRKHPGVHLAVFELGTGTLIPVKSVLPAGRAWGSTASWSPDGKSIAFHAHAREAQNDRAVFVQRLDSPESVLKLTPDGDKNIAAKFSPDGMSVVFYDPRPPRPAVRVARTDGSGEPFGISGLGATPAWLPDGRGVAYTSNLRGKHGVMVAHLGGLDPRPVAITAERKGASVSATVTSRIEKVQQVALRWGAFDANSFRIGQPSGSAEPVELKPGEKVEWPVELSPKQARSAVTVKVIALNQDGVGAVKLVDWVARRE